ncbi:MAG: substrate-binding domain-containing protein [Treponema sp.]|jgi:hypothetical protein|nr:substrate-binding domain-containing protein [Treponema sp.]
MKKIFWYAMFFCCLSYGYAQKIEIKEVTASSVLTDSQGSYPASNLVNYNYQSWAEGARGNGIDESFTLTPWSGAQIAGFALKNGYGDLNYFTANNRVKSFKIYMDGKYIETIPIKDSIYFEQYPLKTPVKGTKIQFVIDSVYQGTTYNDTCIAEIALLSEVLSDEVFYNRILRMLGAPDDAPTIWDTNFEKPRAGDPDRIRLLEYMPFDYDIYYSKTKRALLDRPSSLRLTSDLPQLDGATAAYPLYSANNITRSQVRDIYSGRVTNWKTINGNDDVIIPYQRQENSGSQTIFQTIMGREQTLKPILDGEYIPRGMSGMVRMVASDYYNYNSAIGYTFLFYLNHMTGNTSVKTLSIDGIPPSRETIRSGVYPFAQTVYAVTAGNESENTKKFISWISSVQGQELVEKTGYIPVRE